MFMIIILYDSVAIYISWGSYSDSFFYHYS